MKTTRIFAARRVDLRQILVYSMAVTAKEELAMILPIPCQLSAPDDAVSFINMESYSGFFDDLEALFPKVRTKSVSGGFGGGFGAEPKLKVHDVGQFVASFIPSLKDFNRLDERFRIDPNIWLTQAQYAEYGFVVFQLRSASSNDGERDATGSIRKLRPHPMAFEFPVRDSQQRLFFPTVHIHDGTMPPKAGFDHVLYGQTNRPGHTTAHSWKESPSLISRTVDLQKASHLVLANSHCYRRELTGKLKNQDTWL